MCFVTRSKDKNIQVSVVNSVGVGNSDINDANTYLSCLAPSDRIYAIDTLSLDAFSAIHETFANNICVPDTSSPTTAFPTFAPVTSDGECTDNCDAFTVSVIGIDVAEQDRRRRLRHRSRWSRNRRRKYRSHGSSSDDDDVDDIVCYEYEINRRSDQGRCSTELTGLLLHICGNDTSIIKDEDDIEELLIEDDSGSSTHDSVSISSYDGYYGIGVRVYINVQDTGKFTICMRDINQNGDTSDKVVFKQKRWWYPYYKVYSCINGDGEGLDLINDGLPCLADGITQIDSDDSYDSWDWSNWWRSSSSDGDRRRRRRRLIEFDQDFENVSNDTNNCYWINIVVIICFMFIIVLVYQFSKRYYKLKNRGMKYDDIEDGKNFGRI